MRKRAVFEHFIYCCKLFVTYPAVRTSNIYRESPNRKTERNKRNKARPGKMYNIRLNIKIKENALPLSGEMPYVNEG